MVLHCAGESKVQLLARFDEATGSDDVLGATSVLLQVKVVGHDVLVVQSLLKVQHLALSDESA